MPRHLRLFAVLLLLVLAWALVHYTGLRAQFSVQRLQDGFAEHRLVGLLLFSALFALGNLIQIPGWIFLAAAVLALGRWWGGLATYFAASVSCVTTFWLIRLLGADALRRLDGRWSRRLLARLDAHPLQSVVLLRLVFQTAPALNYALALSGLRFAPYLLGTLIGLPLPIAVYSLFFDSVAGWLQRGGG